MDSAHHDNGNDMDSGDACCATAASNCSAGQREPTVGVAPAPERAVNPAHDRARKRCPLRFICHLAVGCIVSIVLVSIMHCIAPFPTAETPTRPTASLVTVPLPISAPIATRTEASDQPNPSKWCWCNSRGADGRMSTDCIAGSPDDDYCICRCPMTATSQKSSESENFWRGVAIVSAVLSLPWVLVLVAEHLQVASL
nr:hypothetical protein [Pandoravirus massiliensis]